MSNKHKYYDVIVAWANGEIAQYNFLGAGWKDFTGIDSIDVPGFNNRNTEWRVKPKTVIKKYRMALFNDSQVVAYDVTDSTWADPIEYKLR